MPLFTLLKSHYTLWVILTVPACLLTARYAMGSIVYGEFIHVTGEFSARLLIVTMAATPLRLMFPRAGWTAALVRWRRYFGVAAFLYALLHLGAYLLRMAPERIRSEALQADIAAGWLALLIMFALAVTSNDRSMRLLAKAWKKLHRWVYAAAFLTFAHWALTAFNPVPAFIHVGEIALLEGYRVWKTRASR